MDGRFLIFAITDDRKSCEKVRRWMAAF